MVQVRFCLGRLGCYFQDLIEWLLLRADCCKNGQDGTCRSDVRDDWGRHQENGIKQKSHISKTITTFAIFFEDSERIFDDFVVKAMVCIVSQVHNLFKDVIMSVLDFATISNLEKVFTTFKKYLFVNIHKILSNFRRFCHSPELECLSEVTAHPNQRWLLPHPRHFVCGYHVDEVCEVQPLHQLQFWFAERKPTNYLEFIFFYKNFSPVSNFAS